MIESQEGGLNCDPFKNSCNAQTISLKLKLGVQKIMGQIISEPSQHLDYEKVAWNIFRQCSRHKLWDYWWDISLRDFGIT